jgi:hypothetical protein
LKGKPVVALLLPIVLVAMDLVAREFMPVYCHNVLLIFVLVLIVTTRDMVGVGYLVVGMFVMLLWHVYVVKIPSKRGYTAFIYIEEHPTDICPLNVPETMTHETISIII